ncbi:hypothetical protein ES703_32586 [subsurface metagenome]
MKRNVGSADRWVRIIVGVVLIVLGVTVIGWWGAIGAIPLLTGAIGWCPLYLPFGLSTRK